MHGRTSGGTLRFGVTYEGLKLGAPPTTGRNNPHSFGVTYEGLKLPLLAEHLAQDDVVLELPMRV